jgi:hypothetical protein
MKRSQTYAQIADHLAQTCEASVADDGTQRGSLVNGELWDGTLYLCMGEMHRVRGVDPVQILNRDFAAISRSCLQNWRDDSILKQCFAAMGLGMLGPDGEDHPVLGAMGTKNRQHLDHLLHVTRSFSNNWEIFNACLRMGRTALYGDDPEAVLPHMRKMADKYEISGYFDDSAGSGDYNSYGLMTLNFAFRASEFLPPGHSVRRKIEELFRPHALRYAELLRLLIGTRGEGWLFGRSAGVLGQLQCLSFLEQLLCKGWLSEADAAWSRRACRELLTYMLDVFWDEPQRCFLFRDTWRTCYFYRHQLPMQWDLWRYFLQMEDYAKQDEASGGKELEKLPRESVCREVITDPRKHTATLVWSDGDLKWQMPVMGGPGAITGDILPRPYLPGLFEWCTDTNTPPVLCPRFTVDGVQAWPAWWPSETELQKEQDHWVYRLCYPGWVDEKGRLLDLSVRPEVRFEFGSGFLCGWTDCNYPNRWTCRRFESRFCTEHRIPDPDAIRRYIKSIVNSPPPFQS